MIIVGFFMLLGTIVGNVLKSKMNKYARISIRSGLSGAEIAQQMLSYYGLSDVKIVQGQGFLTDHYNPATKTVSLSPAIFQGNSIASAAVAAHECGHAVQHAEGYKWLQMRSRLVPVVQFGSRFYFWVILAGLMMGFIQVAWLGVALFGASTLFSIITLPVEYDASNRALVWLNKSGITQGKEHEGAKDALKAAANTYLVAAIASIGQLMYWVMRVMASSRD